MAGTVQRSDAARGESTPLHLHRPRVLAFMLGAATGWLLRVVIDVLTLDPFAHPPGGER